MTPEHRYAVIKTIYSSKHFTIEEKQALKDKAFANDTSDKAHQVQSTCDYALPDAALKEKLWNDFIDPNCTDSVLVGEQKVSGFWNKYQQLDLIEPYFEKYY